MVEEKNLETTQAQPEASEQVSETKQANAWGERKIIKKTFDKKRKANTIIHKIINYCIFLI